ncbi:hypothetical protein BD626DRAFT_518837 [Schizophyllum amplum]|uniref:F-box domain-containing protein n=1 Tax=Schizophyllum amplum TaxID=97359 RepID=A0A550BVK4_9AGAR|nr:hypothetical protein BD626DRAFT_518837 [Auriculariopsis ampla]
MRRSSRIAAAYQSKRADPVQPTNGKPLSESQSRKRHKRVEGSSSTPHFVKGLQGKLANIAEMPLDILFEIFAYVDPEDLLNLSRLTKAWRALLMNRSASPVWRRILAKVKGLPSIPDDMNEPQYVALVCGKHCDYCGSSIAVKIAWLARVVYCRKCFSKKFFPYSNMPDTFSRLRHILPDQDEMRRVVPYVTIKEKRRDRTWLYRWFSAVACKELMADLNRPQMIKGDQQFLQDYWNDKEQRLDNIKKHAALCEKWEQDRREDKEKDMERMRNLREEAIQQRLIDLGWGDEFGKLYHNPLGQHRKVRIAEPLTEKRWLAIKDELVELMQNAQRRRLAELREDALGQRYRSLGELLVNYYRSQPMGIILPRTGDFANFEALSRVIEGTPFDQKVSEHDLQDALEAVPRSSFDEWHARCEDSLVAFIQHSMRDDQLIRDALGLDDITRDNLRLAIMVYGTSSYGDPIQTYPRVLVWPRLTRVYGWIERRWSTDELVLRHESIAMACRAVELAGGDAQTMTVDEMDALDPWYSFAGEEKRLLKRRAYPWRDAIHDSQFKRINKLMLLGPEDTAAARACLAASKCDVFFPDSIAQCAHCEQRPLCSGELYAHLKRAHVIDRPRRQDFVAGPDIHHHATRAPVDLPLAIALAHGVEAVPNQCTSA